MLKIGVFGVCHLANSHLNNWKEIEGAEVDWFLSTRIMKRLRWLLKNTGCRDLTDPMKLVAACDAVDIVAPTSYHFEICKAAILKGKHVFVEKAFGEYDG